jgi:hypothetical protein
VGYCQLAKPGYDRGALCDPAQARRNLDARHVVMLAKPKQAKPKPVADVILAAARNQGPNGFWLQRGSSRPDGRSCQALDRGSAAGVEDE